MNLDHSNNSMTVLHRSSRIERQRISTRLGKDRLGTPQQLERHQPKRGRLPGESQRRSEMTRNQPFQERYAWHRQPYPTPHPPFESPLIAGITITWIDAESKGARRRPLASPLSAYVSAPADASHAPL